MSGVDASQIDDGICVLVLLCITGKDGGKVAGTDGQDELVSIEVDVAAGQGDVG